MSSIFTILLYHGVSREDHIGIENCSRKHISVDEFAGQMKDLSSTHRVARMSDVPELCRSGDDMSNVAIVTFDDGYLNNFTEAYPVLVQYNVPATFYLATGFIGTSRVFWTDRVEYLINETTKSNIAIDALCSEYSLCTMHNRKEALMAIKQRLKAETKLVDPVLAELEAKSDVKPDYKYPDYQMMRWDHVREMAGTGLCDFGGHTVDHEILAHLDSAEKEHQITGARDALKLQLGQAPELFSYPEGLAVHYDDETIGILKAAGFRSSPSAIFGWNNSMTSPFHLRRNMVGFTAPYEVCIERKL